jgi:hypothetical protein
LLPQTQQAKSNQMLLKKSLHLFLPQQQVEQPKNMTLIVNDTSRTPLQAMATLLSQP